MLIAVCQPTNTDVSRNTAEVIPTLFCQHVKSQIKLPGTLSSETPETGVDSDLSSLEQIRTMFHKFKKKQERETEKRDSNKDSFLVPIKNIQFLNPYFTFIINYSGRRLKHQTSFICRIINDISTYLRLRLLTSGDNISSK